jgi:hypothetical protein
MVAEPTESGPQTNQEAAPKPDADQSSSSARILARHTESFVNAVTGAILVDLTAVAEKVAYRRVSGLHMVPDDAHVELIVGHMKVDPKTIRLIRTQIPRLSVRVLGEPYAVGRWVAALRSGDVLSDELPLGVST